MLDKIKKKLLEYRRPGGYTASFNSALYIVGKAAQQIAWANSMQEIRAVLDEYSGGKQDEIIEQAMQQ